MEEFRPEAADQEKKPHRLVLEGGSIDTNGAGILLTTEARPPRQRSSSATQASAIKRRHASNSKKPSTMTSASRRPSGFTAAPPATTPTAISTSTSPASSPTTPSSPASSTARTTRTTPSRRNLDVSAPPATCKANRSRSSNSPCPRPSSSRVTDFPPATQTSTSKTRRCSSLTFSTTPAHRHSPNIIAACFLDRKIIGIHSVDLIWGLGALHCMTQQEPA